MGVAYRKVVPDSIVVLHSGVSFMAESSRSDSIYGWRVLEICEVISRPIFIQVSHDNAVFHAPETNARRSRAVRDRSV